MLDEILKALRAGDATHACHLARSGLGSQPDNAGFHHLLGVALAANGEHESAMASVDRAIELNPEDAAFHVTRGFMAMQRGESDAAREGLQAAVGLNPNALSAYLSLARLEASSGNLDAAEGQLRLAQRVAPELPETLVVQGQLLLARNDTEGALKAFLAAARGAPDDPLPQVCIAITMLQRDTPAVAEQALHNAIRMRPQARTPRQMLLRLLLNDSRFDDALQAIKPLFELMPDDTGLWFTLALIQVQRGQLPAAIGALYRLLRINPEHREGMGLLQRLWVRRPAMDEARALLEDLLTHHPHSLGLWRARYAVDAAQPRGAEVLERWAAARPNDVELAEAHAARAENDNAGDTEVLVDAVLARAPDRPSAQLIKARAELARDPAAALERVNRVLDKTDVPPLRAACLALAGQAHDRRQQPDQAVASWCALWALPGAGAELPAFAETRATQGRADGTPARRLLWCLPGSPAEATLRAFGRTAGIGSGLFGTAPRSAAPSVASAAAPPASAESDSQEARPLIDSVPFVDTELLAALPEARLLVLLGDPRDLLLNWLAFGAPQRHGLPQPEAGADWLAAAFSMILDRQAEQPQRIRLLSVERLREDSAAALADAVAFLEIDLPPTDSWQLPLGPGRLPLAFEPGHWRNYADALGSSFDRLHGVAERLQAQFDATG